MISLLIGNLDNSTVPWWFFKKSHIKSTFVFTQLPIFMEALWLKSSLRSDTSLCLVYTLYLLYPACGKEDPESHSASRGGHGEGRATTHISPKISFETRSAFAEEQLEAKGSGFPFRGGGPGRWLRQPVSFPFGKERSGEERGGAVWKTATKQGWVDKGPSRAGRPLGRGTSPAGARKPGPRRGSEALLLPRRGRLRA